jgi:hypothetical protein
MSILFICSLFNDAFSVTQTLCAHTAYSVHAKSKTNMSNLPKKLGSSLHEYVTTVYNRKMSSHLFIFAFHLLYFVDHNM